MSKAAADQKIKEVRELISDDDLAGAVTVLREGLTATKSARKRGEWVKGQKNQVQYIQIPDNSIRMNCAKMLLEYGFGKPHTSHAIEVKGGGQPQLTTADIAARIAASGADLARIASAYTDGLAQAEPVVDAIEEGPAGG
tara:strand:+ start:3446 stop:3865 length:420 start_codon:yes stop_codon:yes gene_type:complete